MMISSGARFLTAGVVVLAIVMGIGRFAYTPLLPSMHHWAGLSQSMAGIVASANLFGYLIGALAATGPLFRRYRVVFIRIAVAVVVIMTAAMVLAFPAAWIVDRFLTGVASGIAFVLASSLVLDRAANEHAPHWVGIFYGGVGVGIVLTGVLVPPLAAVGGWEWGWIGLAIVAAVLAFTTLWLCDAAPQASTSTHHAPESPVDHALFWPVFFAYGMQGFGYVIPATFMVAMIVGTPGLGGYAAYSWVVVGLVAIPSTLFWSRVGRAIGYGEALLVALVTLALGAVAPILARNALGVALAAVTLGGTFMGGTMLASALGRQLYPDHSHVAIGRLTVIFGVGQIAGPLVAAVLSVRSGSYDSSLIAAAAVVGCGAAVLFSGVVAARFRGRAY